MEIPHFAFPHRSSLYSGSFGMTGHLYVVGEEAAIRKQYLLHQSNFSVRIAASSPLYLKLDLSFRTK
jgi:hypothetical protein